ncbi:MAG: LURP-one-related/scramblase family protein [Arachnia sp.]
MLTRSPVLVIDQVTSVFTNDFAIHGPDESVLGHIRTEGGGVGRLFFGNREFSVFDASGALMLQLHDEFNVGLDTFSVYDAGGHQLAQVIRELAFFKEQLTIAMADGALLNVAGQFLDFEYDITGGGVSVAHVSRHLPGMSGVLLGRDRYVVSFDERAPGHFRLAVLGATICIDLIRSKRRRS